MTRQGTRRWLLAALIDGISLTALLGVGSAPAFAQAADLAGPARSTPPDARRPGSDFMSPALQALQRDDTQNPAMLWVSEGEALWARPAANGRSCAGCHASVNASAAASSNASFNAPACAPWPRATPPLT
jgi:hypothetical protein